METVFLQSAAALANSLRNQLPIPEDALITLSSNKERARFALIEYGATRFQRELYDEGELRQIPGQTLILYKAPLPGEQQARLSYEYLLSEFKIYLKQKAFAVITSESDAHLGIWLPEGAKLELDDLWQSFLDIQTNPVYFTKTFVKAANAIKLSSGAGFSTLKVPIINQNQALGLASFYYLGIQKSIEVYERDLETCQLLYVKLQGDTTSSQKKVKDDLDKLKKKLHDYETNFATLYSRNLHTIGKKEALIFAENLFLEGNKNPKSMYVAMKRIQPKKMMAIKALANRFNNTAKEQLNSSRPDILCKIFLEFIKLIFFQDSDAISPNLINIRPFLQGIRRAGDNNSLCCYSCGRLIDDTDSYPTFRFLFQSPDQRPQSGSSDGDSQKPKVCSTCAALSLMSPIKLADETLVIRFGHPNTAIEEKIKLANEKLLSLEIGATVGKYVSIVCTEKHSDKKKTPAITKLGVEQYAYAKLGQMYPETLLKSLDIHLFYKGTQMALSRSTAFSTAAIMRVFKQGVVSKDSKNKVGVNISPLGSAIRYLQRGSFYAATYTISKYSKEMARDAKIPNWHKGDDAEIESVLKEYCEILQEENQEMANFTRDVQALVGILMPSCRQIMAVDLKRYQEITGRSLASNQDVKEWREKEVAKLIQQVSSGEPTTFTYSVAKTIGSVSYLKRDEYTRFAFDEAHRLIKSMAREDDLKDIFVERDGSQAIKVSSDLISQAVAFLKDCYSDYERKQLFYHVRLGLFSRFQDSI